MHGPPLTPQEAVAWVARRVRRFEDHGLDRHQAIRRAAVETGIDSEKVRWCAETAFGGATVRLSRSAGHRRRPSLAAAAVA